MLPEVRMARVLDAISSHRAGRLSCVEAGELLGFSERHFRRLRAACLDCKAAERFGVSLASAVRYCALHAKQGDARFRSRGGDRYSHKMEAHADFIRTPPP